MVRILTQSLKIITILLVAVGAAAGAAWFFDYWQDRDPSDAGRPVVLEVTSDDDSGSVAEKLQDGDLIPVLSISLRPATVLQQVVS